MPRYQMPRPPSLLESKLTTRRWPDVAMGLFKMRVFFLSNEMLSLFIFDYELHFYILNL
jgi:hypothetical protein